jgi:hypothetical protein
MARRPEPPDDRPNIGTTPYEEGLQALRGEEMPEDQDAILEPDEIEGRRQPTQTELDDLDPDVPVDPDAVVDPLAELAPDGLRDGETDDPDAAAEEGIPWVPPMDPPIAPVPWPDDPADVVVAAGTGTSALDEDYDESGTLLPDEGELNARIREALRADGATSRLADTLLIAVVGSTAVIRGVVDDIEDSDNIVAVVERVPGIDEVRDETEFPGL